MNLPDPQPGLPTCPPELNPPPNPQPPPTAPEPAPSPLPITDKDVLAKISYTGSLGESRWYEVVYHGGTKWQAYDGSRTFEDGEQVKAWIYCDGIKFPTEPEPTPPPIRESLIDIPFWS